MIELNIDIEFIFCTLSEPLESLYVVAVLPHLLEDFQCGCILPFIPDESVRMAFDLQLLI